MVGAGAVKTDAVIDFGKGRGDGGDVAAMAVQPVDALKAVARQRLGPVHHRRDHGGRAQGDGAGKRHVMLRLADIESGTDQEIAIVAGALPMISGHSASVPSRPLGPCCSVEPIGIRMALERGQIGLDLRPGRKMKLHMPPYCGAVDHSTIAPEASPKA